MTGELRIPCFQHDSFQRHCADCLDMNAPNTLTRYVPDAYPASSDELRDGEERDDGMGTV
ncbi:MAG: hypothetical protein ACR652_17850 [Methylocystis sp.]|uniref:hypothetical protein n=1 Tax=Methylocystis sp. TaxID=1911079 RepID=UPI003DA34429